jgi:hypothetical protein
MCSIFHTLSHYDQTKQRGSRRKRHTETMNEPSKAAIEAAAELECLIFDGERDVNKWEQIIQSVNDKATEDCKRQCRIAARTAIELTSRAAQPQEWTPESLATQFHEIYERLAPQFGYETRTETRKFDTETPNGKLMVAVCDEIIQSSINKAKVAAQKLCEVYFNIAAEVIGEDEVRKRRDEAIDAAHNATLKP